MKTKLYLFQRAGRLACRWIPTGDPRMPLACIWTGSKAAQAAPDASSTEEAGRMHLCA